MAYAPQGKPAPVVQPGDFVFAAVGLDHGHIFGQCNGLIEAGATLKWVCDPDAGKVAEICAKYPGAAAARSLEEILADPEVSLVTSAAVPCERGPLGCRVMAAGKDYFTDKGPFTTLEQLAQARTVAAKTGRKYMVYYSERLHVESAMLAGVMVREGEIGRVVQVLGLGPHRLNAPTRPPWFFDRRKYGGILCDIGSHQVEQFLSYTGASDATVTMAAVANFDHPQHPDLEDFGEVSLTGDNGTSNYFRVDWFTPDGLRTWGDGRTIILGTQGYIELRKYIDVGRDPLVTDSIILVNGQGERVIDARNTIGYPFFGQLILDCLNRTENAMTQAHAFKAAELCLRAQAAARVLAG